MVDLACSGSPFEIRDRLVLVPTRAAATYLLRAIEHRRLADNAIALPDLVTRDEFVVRLGTRLSPYHTLLTGPEREVLAGVACRAAAEDGHEPPFRLRPGLVAEIVRFYDSLQRNLKSIDTFERFTLGALEPAAAHDRGAERLVRQTRFLVSVFRHFERCVAQTGRTDEHLLRSRLITEVATRPWRHVVLSVGDHASDRHGLLPADWDLLSRVPGLERIDLVTTDGLLAGAFHERIHQFLPGIEETHVARAAGRSSPVLLIPSRDVMSHTTRDREEEVAGFARWVRREMHSEEGRTISGLDRIALVVRRPLPYVYLTREVLRSAGIPVQMFDALPLASEPFAAAVDLVVTFVLGNFARGPAVALLRSPHFQFGSDENPLTSREVSLLDRALSDAGYLGDLGTLERLVMMWQNGEAAPRPGAVRAGEVLLRLARELAALRSPGARADHLARLQAFIVRYEARSLSNDSFVARHRRGRAAVFNVLSSLHSAHAQFDSRHVEFDETSAVLRRWIDTAHLRAEDRRCRRASRRCR